MDSATEQWHIVPSKIRLLADSQYTANIVYRSGEGWRMLESRTGIRNRAYTIQMLLSYQDLKVLRRLKLFHRHLALSLQSRPQAIYLHLQYQTPLYHRTMCH